MVIFSNQITQKTFVISVFPSLLSFLNWQGFVKTAAGKKKASALFVHETVCYVYLQSQSWENQIQPDLAHESYLRIIGAVSGDGSTIECQS